MNIIKINERAFYIALGYAEIIDVRKMHEAAFVYQQILNLPCQFLILKDRFGEAPRLATSEELQQAITKTKDFYNPPEIKVTITGPKNSGKSSIAAALMEVLTKYDLPVTWESMDEDQVDVTAIYRVKLNKMRECGTTIKIVDNND